MIIISINCYFYYIWKLRTFYNGFINSCTKKKKETPNKEHLWRININ